MVLQQLLCWQYSLSSLAGKIGGVHLPPLEPQKSNNGHIAGGIGGVTVAMVLIVILVVFIRKDSCNTSHSIRASDKKHWSYNRMY